MNEPSPTVREPIFVKALAFLDMLVFLGFGIAFIVVPETLLEEVELPLTAPAALIEIRAMYGGLQLGLAAFIAASFLGHVRRRDAILLSGLALAGLASVRGIGMLVAGVYGVHLQLISPEAIGAAINLAVYVKLRERG